jgi:hypothetical protein
VEWLWKMFGSTRSRILTPLLIMCIINGDHLPNFFRQMSLLFHKWLAERFNLDDAWIVSVWYKDTSIYNALITCIGKLCTFRSQTKLFSRLFYIINLHVYTVRNLTNNLIYLSFCSQLFQPNGCKYKIQYYLKKNRNAPYWISRNTSNFFCFNSSLFNLYNNVIIYNIKKSWE